MHSNPAFRKPGEGHNLAFARDTANGILTVNGPEGPLASHLPFDLDMDGHVYAHLTRSNPILKAAQAGTQACLIVSGPHGYVSPDWYGQDDQVPTYNYVAIHLRGTLTERPADTLKAHLDALSARFETRLAPKPVWSSDKMGAGVMERMMRMIVPVMLRVTRVDGTWKLNQNKDAAARLGAAEHMGDPALAALMRDPPA